MIAKDYYKTNQITANCLTMPHLCYFHAGQEEDYQLD